MLVSVFNKQTITASVQTIVSESPPLTRVSTVQEDVQNRPFMFAFDYLTANGQLNASQLPFRV